MLCLGFSWHKHGRLAFAFAFVGAQHAVPGKLYWRHVPIAKGRRLSIRNAGVSPALLPWRWNLLLPV
jgi:hypothetical protein